MMNKTQFPRNWVLFFHENEKENLMHCDQTLTRLNQERAELELRRKFTREGVDERAIAALIHTLNASWEQSRTQTGARGLWDHGS